MEMDVVMSDDIKKPPEVDILTTSKVQVDSMCPVAKTAYVYYDDNDVFDSALTEMSTGTIHVAQLIFDIETKLYYTDYTLDGPYDTTESAKEAFLVTYKEKFDIEWADRKTKSERWTYEVKTYEPYEEVEEVEEIIEEAEAEVTIARENEMAFHDTKIRDETGAATAEIVTVEPEIKKETAVAEDDEETIKG
ncbi:hypothetical protein BGZ70_005153, partial [Mortierella alpina]